MKVYFDLLSLIIYILFAVLGMTCCNQIKNKERASGKQVRLASRFYLLWIFSWSIMASMRLINAYGVGGTDAYMYISFFQNCNSFQKMLSAEHFDIGFKLFTYIVRLFINNYHVYTFVCAFIIVLSYAVVIKELCPFSIETIPLVLIFYIFLRGFTTFRTNLSVAFLLLGIVYLYKKNYLKSFVLLITSILFHKASIIYVMIFPFIIIYNKRKLKVKESFALICLGIIFGKCIQTLMLGDFGQSLGGAYSSYASRSIGTSFFDGFWKIALEQMLLALCMLGFKRQCNKYYLNVTTTESEKFKFIWNVCIFDFIMIPITYIISMWRGYEYLYIIRLIMWGALLDILLKYFDNYSKRIVQTLSLIVFITWLMWRVYETYESSGLLPYKLFIMSSQ